MKADDIAEAGEVLRDHFVDFEVDPRLIEQVLTAHPDLLVVASAWGWDDTEARSQLADALARTLLDRSWPTYGQPRDLESFREELRAAHARWVLHPKAESPRADDPADASADLTDDLSGDRQRLARSRADHALLTTLRDIDDGHLSLWARVAHHDSATGEQLAEPKVLRITPDRQPHPGVPDAQGTWWTLLFAL
ncbi:hypothetical protein, partial [Nonomuraea sp. NPDC049784]|uniref:hypothetical protein n=1 Tax=Nonomuraea sp. NPDC049784 TaxID=3154361 RepID=UPI0033F13809